MSPVLKARSAASNKSCALATTSCDRAVAMVGIGPMVLERERNVSTQLAQIELLERESSHTDAHH